MAIFQKLKHKLGSQRKLFDSVIWEPLSPSCYRPRVMISIIVLDYYRSLAVFLASSSTTLLYKGKGTPYSITVRRVLGLIPVLGSQPAGDMSHKPGGRLPILSARTAVTPATLKRTATNFAAWWTEAQWVWTVCLIKTVTRQRRDCDLNPGPSAPESSTLTTRLPSHITL